MESNKSYFLPVSILVAAVLISASIFYVVGRKASSDLAGGDVPLAPEEEELTASLTKLKAVSNNDHIKGNPKASVKIVEFSDFECPFCSLIHPTLNKIVSDYGDQVAWVYRHFPLESIHPTARLRAVASECVAELGGNEAFWNYTDKLFNDQQGAGNTDNLVSWAKELGVSEDKFKSCLDSGRYDERINNDIEEAVATGGRGTPWSIAIAPNGEKFPINGAQPYEAVKQIVEQALKAK